MNFAKSLFRYLEKRVLKLCLAATIKPRQIEHSVVFSTGPERSSLQLDLGPPYVWFRRNRDSLTEDDDCAPPPSLTLIRVKSLSILDL